MAQLHWLYSELEDQQIASLQNLYSGAIHCAVFLQRPSHFGVYLIVLWHPFLVLSQIQFYVKKVQTR